MTSPSNGRRGPYLATMAAVAVVTAISFGTATDARADTGQIRAAGTADVVADSYLVAFKDTVAKERVSAKASELAARFHGRTGHLFHTAVRGFAVSMSQRDAKRLAADPSVAYVQQNGIYRVADTQSPAPSWGLDRIDQRNLPLNNAYTHPTFASGVKAYVIDTGIRLTHTDFGGRAVSGVDEIDGGTADDANGHGTHVAATIGGSTFGVAKGVTLVAVRVLDASGSGTTADVIAGIDWVTEDHQPGELAVANMSLGGAADSLLDAAVKRSIDDGIVYGVAAGNNNRDACQGSPARVPAAITVGATTIGDARASFSNFGSCVDIFAPGAGITSAWNGSDSDARTISGTSMATPHVVGAAAIALAQNPSLEPFNVRDFLVELATGGVVTDRGSGSPDKLLFCCPVSVTSTTVTPNADGRLTMFAADSGHSVWTRTQLAPGSGTWSNWTRFATALSTIVAKTNGNGLIEVFGADETGRVWHRWQAAPNSASWSTWEVFATALSDAPSAMAVAAAANGGLTFFALDDIGRIWGRVQYIGSNGSNGGGSWSPWGQLDGTLSAITAQTNGNGLIELFGVAPDGLVYHRWELVHNTGSWAPWEYFGASLPLPSTISATVVPNGPVVVFGTDSSARIWGRLAYIGPNGSNGGGSWSPWGQLDGALTGITAITGPDRRNELFGVDGWGKLFHRKELAPISGSWSPWESVTRPNG
ncbi:hypothetical protein Rhe02_19240 [Rhizocola hellebori]|uniref:S8 family peptidase n=1 Tax=Rhizocola hellebori TaxID=1392758 RepID=A0A8J3Q5M9_9ACTN|nr:S8 family serine peptidase [Rhizocola hellebori]GIH03857.1 hypothetical protein Rhe02_19240 [Rhizocola hellebori]